jgi:hypothetical protein
MLSGPDRNRTHKYICNPRHEIEVVSFNVSCYLLSNLNAKMFISDNLHYTNGGSYVLKPEFLVPAIRLNT